MYGLEECYNVSSISLTTIDVELNDIIAFFATPRHPLCSACNKRLESQHLIVALRSGDNIQ